MTRTRFLPTIARRCLCAVAVCLSACSTLTPSPRAAQFTGSLQELMPHSDGDHFVYVWRRTLNGRFVGDGIQVEHLTAVGTSGEFEVALSENGLPVGVTRVRDNGHALLLLSEDLGPNLRLSYDPPLPQVEIPLPTHEQHASATATVTRVSDGQTIGSMQVTQTVRASDASPVQSPLGKYKHGVLLQTARSLTSSTGIIELSTSTVLVPGIGEIRSDGMVTGAAAVHRDLACAFISGRPLGDCSKLNEQWEQPDDAGDE